MPMPMPERYAPSSVANDTTSHGANPAAIGLQFRLCSAPKHHHNARTNMGQHDSFDMSVRTWSVSAPRDSKRRSSSDPLPVAEPPPQPWLLRRRRSPSPEASREPMRPQARISPGSSLRTSSIPATTHLPLSQWASPTRRCHRSPSPGTGTSRALCQVATLRSARP